MTGDQELPGSALWGGVPEPGRDGTGPVLGSLCQSAPLTLAGPGTPTPGVARVLRQQAPLLLMGLSTCALLPVQVALTLWVLGAMTHDSAAGWLGSGSRSAPVWKPAVGWSRCGRAAGPFMSRFH